MEVQKENYIKLLEELSKLEKELEDSHLILKEKENEKEIMENRYDDINKEIERKNIEKEKMLNNNKLITIYAIIAGILTCAFAATFAVYFGNKFVSIPLGLEKAKYLGITILGTLGVGSISMFGLSRLGRIILKKHNMKITNSDKYQNILKEIKSRKEERKSIEKRKIALSEECLQATLNYSTQNAIVQIKKAEIKRFKDEVFNEVINNPTKEESNKPYTRIKIKNNNIN